jgi:type IV secretory pathway TrbL component
VRKAQAGAKAKKTISKMPAKTRNTLAKQGAGVAARKRTGSSEPQTRADLYEMAKKRDLPGRSKMDRDEWPRPSASDGD